MHLSLEDSLGFHITDRQSCVVCSCLGDFDLCRWSERHEGIKTRAREWEIRGSRILQSRKQVKGHVSYPWNNSDPMDICRTTKIRF